MALGCVIAGNTFYYLYAFDYIIGIDLETGVDNWIWTAPILGMGVDGLAADNSGYLYVVGRIDGRIYKIRISDKTTTELVSSGLPDLPQELYYDEINDRLVVCSWSSQAPIVAVDVNSGEITELVSDNIAFRDGITMDPEGNIYTASEYYGVVSMFENGFTGPPITIIDGLDGPAGLEYRWDNRILAVPVTDENRVIFLSMVDTDGDGRADIIDICPDYHNPDQCDYQPPGEADGLPPRDILDIVHLIDYKFKECPPGAGLGTCPPPTPFDIYSGDTDCNCIVDILDIVLMVDWKFKECPPGAGQGTCPPPCSCEEWVGTCQCPIR
jgi:hypothetical protein